ncbi:unnamed protein product [Rotaria magnacalcarata]
MDEIDIALQFAKKKKIDRLKTNNIRRCNTRFKSYSNFRSSSSFDIDDSMMVDFNSINLVAHNNKSSKSHILPCLMLIIHLGEHITENDHEEESIDISDNSLVNDLIQQKEKNISNLHQYTSTHCLSFAENLTSFIRKANIAKSHVENLIGIIQMGLPQPNTFPTNYCGLLDLLSVEDIFVKRVVCINCKNHVSISSTICLNCASGKRQRLAFDRLYTIIDEYRKLFTQRTLDNETNDIVYNRNYKILCNLFNYPFISIILHLDGISLSASNKQSMWMLSCSIVELPPEVRNRRQNNLILSIWIGKEQPDIDLWLGQTLNQLAHLKSKGFSTRLGSQMMLKVYAMIGDCPALSMSLNHNSHGGYYCRWYCKVKGKHIYKKRQCYYNINRAIRDSFNFASDSREAARLQTKVNGRLGISLFEKILDIPLPKSVIADYLHVTLLCHSKAICLYLYNNVMKLAERKQLDQRMLRQQFPHFFNRKVRLFSEGYHKATETRNFLLYCALPMLQTSLGSERLAHFALFAVGIRLLHGRRVFDDTTADRAHELLTTFYRDHETFYIGKQNFVLHLHEHFAQLYKDHGSLCNINTFSQEDLIGAVSKYKHGSRCFGDQIIFYLNIDFALKNANRYEESLSNSTCEGLLDINTTPNELIEVLPDIHKKICNCYNVDKLLNIEMTIQREKRVSRPHNRFSPSDNFNRCTHYLLYFDSTDSYSIALSSSVNKITGNTATVNIRGKNTLATVITSVDDANGSESEGIDMSPCSDHDRAITAVSVPNRQRIAITTNSVSPLSDHERQGSATHSDDDDDQVCSQPSQYSPVINSSRAHTKSTINKQQRKQSRTPSKASKRQRHNDINNHNKHNEQANVVVASVMNQENNTKNIVKQLENHFSIFQNNIMRSFQKIEKRINTNLGSNLLLNSRLLDQYRTEKGEVYRTELMDNGINLLNTFAKDPIDFCRKTLKLLYSEEELKNSTLPPKRDYLRREALDERRFAILLEAVRIKFRLDSNRMQDVYNDLLKVKLGNFLYEERRRATRRRLRAQERVLKQNTFQFNQDDDQRSSDDDDDEEEEEIL